MPKDYLLSMLMRKVKSISLSAAVLGTALCFAVSLPASAHDGVDSDKAGEHRSNHSTVKTESSDATRIKTVVGRTGENQTVQGIEHQTPEPGDDNGAHLELHRKGEALTAELRKQRGSKVKTAEQRQKVCEGRKNGLTNKFSRTVTNSQRIQARFDEVLSKAQTYQQAKNITVANWDGLVAGAQAAQATSAASIAALQAVTPAINCTSATVADSVATFKTAAGQTRDGLKAYRTAVKAVLKALITAKSGSAGGIAQ